MTDIIWKLTKGCRRKCRISYDGTTHTLMGWEPTYDTRGKQIGEDPNTRTASYRCNACGTHWQVVRKAGEQTILTYKPEEHAAEQDG